MLLRRLRRSQCRQRLDPLAASEDTDTKAAWMAIHRTAESGNPHSTRARLDGGETVIHEEMSSVYETRLVNDQEERRTRDFFWLEHPALLGGQGSFRYINTKAGERLDCAQAIGRADESWADCIAANAAIPEFDGDCASALSIWRCRGTFRAPLSAPRQASTVVVGSLKSV